MFKLPSTSNFAPGVAVPMPTLPLIIIPFDGGAFTPAYVPAEVPPATSNFPFGLVVPMPTLPVSIMDITSDSVV